MNEEMIKYTLVPIVENNNTVCYVASKCYYIGELREFNKNIVKINYLIVYPIEFDEEGNLSATKPIFDDNNNCVNASITNELYDSYEDVINAKKMKNYLLFVNLVKDMDKKELSRNFDLFRKQHLDKIDNYGNFESLLISNIDDNVKQQNNLLQYIKQ